MVCVCVCLSAFVCECVLNVSYSSWCLEFPCFHCVIDAFPLSLGVDLKVKDIIVDGKTYTVRLW